jgi:hypothetical protein
MTESQGSLVSIVTSLTGLNIVVRFPEEELFPSPPHPQLVCGLLASYPMVTVDFFKGGYPVLFP